MITERFSAPATFRLFCTCLALAGCSGLPAADGTEATLKKKADTLQPVKPSSAHDLEGIVYDGLILHPKIRSAASNVAVSADEVRVERAAFFPSLGLSLGGGKGPAGNGGVALQLTGKQLLSDFGKTDRKVMAADVDLQIKYLTFQKTVDDAVVELVKAYNSVRLYQDILKVRKDQLAGMQELAGKVEKRISAGASSNADQLETQKRLQSLQFEVQDAELSLADARDQLMRLSGHSKGGKVLPPPVDCRKTPESEDLRIAKLKVMKADLDLKTAQNSLLPRVSLSPLARTGEGGGLGLNLNVDSDLLEGGAYTARANAAANALAAAKASVETQTREDALDTRKFTREIRAAERRRAMLKRQIELLAKTRTLYRSQYFDLGTRTISELLDNEEEYFNRQADLMELDASDLSYHLNCAVMENSLRDIYGLTSKKMYGLPLD